MSSSAQTYECPKCHGPVPPDAPQGLCPRCVLGGAAHPTEAGLPLSAKAEIPSLDRVAAAFPQLEIAGLVGCGGMGAVFKARQPHLGRFVALKLLSDKLARDSKFAERFNREGRVLARLNHPNIVSVFDFGQAGGFCYLLMEYVDGVNLRQAMRAGRFSPSEALGIVPKICEALQYAHEQGVLHRDIKPENILLDARGRVKIADFGIAKLMDETAANVTLTATGAALGTPHYMAPEQLERPSEVDHRADIYSLGVVFYEMLTGELPLGRFAPPSEKTPVDRRVDEVVFRTLEKERERRFQSAGEVKTRVEQLSEAGSAPPPAPVPPRWAAAGAPLGPHGTIAAGDFTAVKRPAQALLAAGVLNWLGSLGIIALLAFTRLGQILPLSETETAIVAALVLFCSGVLITGALKMMKLEAYPLAWISSVLAMVISPGNIIGLPAGIWSVVTLLRPEVRLAFKAGKETRVSGGNVRGLWATAGLLLLGLGIAFALLPNWKSRPGSPAESIQSSEKPAPPPPWIRFTFTAVELREDEGGRWLAIDYVDDVRGECEKSFPWEANIQGFTAKCRTSAFVAQDPGFAAVRHQRVEFLLPDPLDAAQARAFRDDLSRTLRAKSVLVRPGERTLLFQLPVTDQGTLAVRIAVERPAPSP